MNCDAAERVARHICETPKLLEIAERCIRQTYTRTAAARQFVEIMSQNLDQPATPVGDRYSQQAFKLAMRGSAAQLAFDLTEEKPHD
ncbi:MAG TPA: hypothetical protein VJ654_13010 [Noviherbaspirillum sp.]|nr:hypothetical protein [Noviherbaspirillum sp.]